MRKSVSGFTIIELLIVIVVIAILASISLVSFSGTQARARDSIRIKDLKEVQKVVELYHAQNGSYPMSSSGSGAWAGNCTSYGASPQYIVGVEEFMPRLPYDPKNGTATVSGANCYLYRSNGTDFMMIAHNTMENICGGDPGNTCNPSNIQAMDRVSYVQPTIAVYSPGARTW